ncbi:BREX-3 system P-loop-containing protein BrxF [Atopococcus tabaci]|uniref:BREX-3 system P-loop-containing protein BrxF n=1 Tax=Atopococcus tabaci TaxID=269774 RepID=UPI00146FA69F|nr:BREX-3 system P-loop-containing protein BrxF [Atopococcus tabaci]
MSKTVNLEEIIQLYRSTLESSYQKIIFLSIPKKNVIENDNPMYSYIHLNIEITKVFQQVEKKMGRKVQKLVEQLIKERNSSIIVLDYYELLFEPFLQINPIDLFLNISKSQPLVVIWRYESNGRKLIYSKPNHPDYWKIELPHQILLIEGDK